MTEIKDIGAVSFQRFMYNVMQPQTENDPHLERTPQRVTDMYRDFFNPAVPSITTFETEQNELVVLNDIPFYSICAHHFVPFFGIAHVAYIPDGRIIGLSKIPRIVDFLAREPQVQERLTTQIADFLFQELESFHPAAVGVVMEARHLCMEMRGVSKQGITTRTSALRGSFLTDASQRDECLRLMSGR